MSRYDASTIHNIEHLITKVAQCMADQGDGMDVLASASWDRVAEWMRENPHTINEACDSCESGLTACFTCGRIEYLPYWKSAGECYRCSVAAREREGLK